MKNKLKEAMEQNQSNMIAEEKILYVNLAQSHASYRELWLQNINQYFKTTRNFSYRLRNLK